MPIQIACTNGHSMAVPDKYAGRKAMCPVCRQLILVPSWEEMQEPPPVELELSPEEPAAPPKPRKALRRDKPPARRAILEPPIEDDDPLDEDRPRRRKRDRYAGMTIVHIGLIIYIVGVLIDVGGSVIANIGVRAGAVGPLVVGAVCMLSAAAVKLVGAVFCCFVSATGARVSAILSIVLEAAIVTLFVYFVLRPPEKVGVYILLAILLPAGWVFFMIFLRQLSQVVRDETCAEESLHVLMAGLGYYFSQLLYAIFLAAGMPRIIGVFISLTLLGFGIWFYIKYFLLLMSVRGSVADST